MRSLIFPLNDIVDTAFHLFCDYDITNPGISKAQITKIHNFHPFFRKKRALPEAAIFL